jgi:uncharacterized protein YoxC
MQPDSSITQDPNPAPQKKAGKFNIQIVFLAIFVLAAAGLGYWAMQSNNTLKSAQQDLNKLQGEYDALTAEKNSLSGELDQTNKDLASTNEEITTTKDALSTAKSEAAKVNNELSALKKKMNTANSYILAIRYIYEDEDATYLGAFLLVTLVDDDTLTDLFNKWMDSPSYGTWTPWAGYAIQTAIDTLTK